MGLYMFTGRDHQPVIRTQSFYFQCFKKDKAIQFQHKHSNLLPHRQYPPSPRVAGSAVTSFPAKTLNCHISRTRYTRIPLFALNWDLLSTIVYTKNHAISSTGLVRICASLTRPRPRGEEGNRGFVIDKKYGIFFISAIFYIFIGL